MKVVIRDLWDSLYQSGCFAYLEPDVGPQSLNSELSIFSYPLGGDPAATSRRFQPDIP